MVAICGIPRINALGLKGPEKGPEKILKNIPHDLLNTPNEDVSLDEDKIFQYALKESNKTKIFIGGDHSITYSTGKAFLQNYSKENSFIIIFDAHPDLMPPMREPTHEEFLKGLLVLGWKPENIILLGVRKIEPEEAKILKTKKIKMFKDESVSEILKYLKEKTLGKQVYLSIDFDVLDPKIFKAVNYPVKKGFTKEKYTSLLNGILKTCDVLNVDLVEYVPEKDYENESLEIIKETILQIQEKIKD